MKGWLDKYNDGGPVQENYNDYSVSAPEGYVGVGTFNKGRNYSPAWGGQFQKGGKVPATKADSIALLNNTQALADYYKKKGYKKLEHYRDSDGEWNIDIGYKKIARLENKQEKKPTEKRQNKIDKIQKKVTDIRESINEDNRYHNPQNYLTNLNRAKQAFDKARFDYDNDEKYGYIDEEGKYVAAKPSSEQYYKPIDANRFGQRDQSFGFMDLGAPMPLFDRRITPQNFVRYETPEGRKYQNTVEFYGYDPLAVTPWNMIPPEQQQQRIQTYGTSGAPADILQQHPDWITPTTAAPEVKPKDQPKYRYTYGKPLFKGGPQTDYYTPIDEAGNVISTSEFKNPEFQNGGNLSFIDNPKLRNMLEGYKPGLMDSVGDYRLPEGYMAGSIYPSTEVSRSIGGEGGEPSYLIPSFKYGQPLQDPTGEFNMTGQHLGGPFKTWQDAEKFGELRHQYVEKGQPLPSPIATSNMAMGGSIPGAVGFTYARIIDPAPSNGKYAKKTMASAQDGMLLNEGEETEAVKTPIVKSEERVKQEESFMDKAPKEILQEGRSKFRYNMLEDAVRHDMALENFTSLEDVDKKELKRRTKELLEKRESKLLNPTIEFVKGNGTRKTPVVGYYDPNNPNALISLSDNLDKYGIDEFANTVRHEFRHAYDEGGKYLTNYEKELIKNKTAVGDVDKIKALGRNMYNYLTHPTEVTARLQEIRGALKDNPRVVEYLRRDPLNADEFKGKYKFDREGYYIDPESRERIPVYRQYDARRDKATHEDLYYLHQKKGSENTSGLIDLLKVMKTEDIVDLLNTIATNNPQQGMPMAQNGGKMSYYQNGLDFEPKGMGKNGKVIKDDRGQWAHPGEITEIGSNQITMRGVPYPVLGISNTGDTQMMYPNEEYEFIGDSVTEYPMMKQGGQLTKLDQLLNFTNYNTKQPGGWLDKYQ